jgi:hypothetical protein
MAYGETAKCVFLSEHTFGSIMLNTRHKLHRLTPREAVDLASGLQH